MHILIIEDDPEFCRLLEMHIKVRWPDAETDELDPMGEMPDAGAILLAGYDLVLLDYLLGDLNGMEMLEQFQQVPDFPPVIMITGSGNERLAVAAIRAGAADYLPKVGLNNEDLINAVAMCTGISVPEPVPSGRPTKLAGELKSVPGYIFDGQLAHGEASSVYRAKSESGSTQVAVKVVPLKGSETRCERRRELAAQEFSALQKQESSFLPKIIEHGHHKGSLYFVMKWLPGVTLAEHLAEISAGGTARALPIARQIASGLRDLHATGMLHRDLKPGNVLLKEDDQSAVLVGFEIAALKPEAGDEGQVKVVDSPYYQCPELWRDEEPSVATDIYAFGILLHELLTGKTPYRARLAEAVCYKHLHAPLPKLPAKLRPWQALVNKTLAKHPEDRFASAEDLLRAVDALSEPLLEAYGDEEA